MKRAMMKLAGLAAWLTGSSAALALSPGDMAPDLAVASTSGEDVNLRALTGVWKVLFFYPKAFTPGCTAQACGMRDANAEFAALGVKVFGSSKDSLESQQKFKEEHSLPYDLLADTGGDLAKAFGSLGAMGVFSSRQTYIIDPEGKITDVIDDVNIGSHDDDVIAILKQRMGR